MKEFNQTFTVSGFAFATGDGPGKAGPPALATKG